MKNKLTSSLAAAGAAAVPASGAILPTILPEPIEIEVGEAIFFSLRDQWTSMSPAPGFEFALSLYNPFTETPSADVPWIYGAYEYLGYNAPYYYFRQGYTYSLAYDPYGPMYWYVSAMRFAAGEAVNSVGYRVSQLYINYYGDNDLFWEAGTRGYLGLKVVDSGYSYYGWADIEYTLDKKLVLYGFAVAMDGSVINAGAIPEPKTTGLLAALAAGSAVLLARRRRAALQNDA